jgi:hypothetical protein
MAADLDMPSGAPMAKEALAGRSTKGTAANATCEASTVLREDTSEPSVDSREAVVRWWPRFDAFVLLAFLFLLLLYAYVNPGIFLQKQWPEFPSVSATDQLVMKNCNLQAM